MRPMTPVFSIAVAFVMTWTLAAQTTRQVNDPVGQLNEKLEAGEVELEHSDDFRYVPSLMEHLDLNPDSQVLVFSKTSFQATVISPEKPRALYFNDDVMLGVVQDSSLLEFASLDPDEGLLFYTFDQAGPASAEDNTGTNLNPAGPDSSNQGEGIEGGPHFQREFGCAACHGPVNRYAPGLIVASVFPTPTGTARHDGEGLFQLTNHRSPFEDRWGGFYVTGTHGDITHRGNAMASNPDQPYELDTSETGNITSLADRFDISKYLEPTSDIVALMTLEHQTGMINLLTSVGAQFRASETFPLPAEELAAEVDKLVSYMLFVGETPMESPIEGVSTFSGTFPERGPRDSEGRSLRDFDLQTRLFQYPLSYMIYSRSFDGLPEAAREQIYQRLYGVLTGSVTDSGFAELGAVRRRDLLEILIETKQGLPEYFNSSRQG